MTDISGEFHKFNRRVAYWAAIGHLEQAFYKMDRIGKNQEHMFQV
jgi:hypothetical protein